MAIAIPIIPNKFPCLEVSGEDKPLKAKINKIPEIKYQFRRWNNRENTY